jgi:hypothetical protein
MRANEFKSAFVATVSAGALFVGLGISTAAAVPFQIDPDALATGGAYPNVTVTDLNGISDATIFQSGANTQTETGWVQGQSFTNNGPIVSSIFTRMCTEGGCTSGNTSFYNLYLLFQGNVNGISNFGPGQSGTVGAGDYRFALYADIGINDVFTAGSTGAGIGINPTVTGGTSDDLLLAVGSSLFGGAGQSATGAPSLSVLADFIICNGVNGQGKLGADIVAASVAMSNWNGGAAQSCGTFNALSYFVDPSPFYKLSFNSSFSGDPNNLTVSGDKTNATLNGIVADINFVSVPEPSTVMLLGAGLLGLWLLVRRHTIQA